MSKIADAPLAATAAWIAMRAALCADVGRPDDAAELFDALAADRSPSSPTIQASP